MYINFNCYLCFLLTGIQYNSYDDIDIDLITILRKCLLITKLFNLISCKSARTDCNIRFSFIA